MGVARHFITFEGGEGAGKSTQIQELSIRLRAAGIVPVITREPGGSPGAEEIRKLLVEGEPKRWSALTELLLMYAARADHIEKTISPALLAGKWVICDRFFDSSMAYQGYARGVDLQMLDRLNEKIVGDHRPNMTFILDIEPRIGLERANQRGGTADRFESFTLEFHQKIRAGFLEIAHKEPERCHLIDASQGQKSVANTIWQIVRTRSGL